MTLNSSYGTTVTFKIGGANAYPMKPGTYDSIPRSTVAFTMEKQLSSNGIEVLMSSTGMGNDSFVDKSWDVGLFDAMTVRFRVYDTAGPLNEVSKRVPGYIALDALSVPSSGCLTGLSAAQSAATSNGQITVGAVVPNGTVNASSSWAATSDVAYSPSYGAPTYLGCYTENSQYPQLNGDGPFVLFMIILQQVANMPAQGTGILPCRNY
jgi:hypothetical protein